MQKKFTLSPKRPVLRILFFILPAAGGISGYLYYRFVGCVTGTCPITSNPVISTAYAAFMGLLASMIIKEWMK